jgi:hypothetical protein
MREKIGPSLTRKADLCEKLREGLVELISASFLN